MSKLALPMVMDQHLEGGISSGWVARGTWVVFTVITEPRELRGTEKKGLQVGLGLWDRWCSHPLSLIFEDLSTAIYQIVGTTVMIAAVATTNIC